MSKLKMKQQLVETTLETDNLGVRLKITTASEDRVVLQFGHYKPVSQQASAADLRELAGIFAEAADLLEGDVKASNTEEKEPEKKGRSIRVELNPGEGNSTLQGVFSELPEEQEKVLRKALFNFTAKLPFGMGIRALD